MLYLKEKSFISVRKNKINLSRITSSGNFIPEIDGLRFIAIISVVLFHLFGFISEKNIHSYTNQLDFSFLTNILKHGDLGVPLFFVLSGFILGLPFAKHHIKSAKKVDLKSYFYRRITRLEPPYIILMTLLCIAVVYTNKMQVTEAINSFLASVFYSHNIIFSDASFINVVAWSLEIEIQFYLLVPILTLLFSIKDKSKRRIGILVAIVAATLISCYTNLKFVFISDYLHYFLIGFLLVDYFLEDSIKKYNTILRACISLLALFILFYFDESYFAFKHGELVWELVLVSLIFISYYNIIIHKSLSFFSNKIITNIGGMCYSIYLLHYVIISFVGNPLLKLNFSGNQIINTIIFSFILLLSILIISTVYYLIIERPCMDKNWPTKLKNYVKRINQTS